MTERLELKAYGKINLGLDVVRKREDGYHEVRMIMQTVDLYDRITMERMESGIRVTANLPYVPDGEGNLAYRAAKLLMEEFGITEGISIEIKKMIPVAAGMAGGSTDAAAVLVALVLTVGAVALLTHATKNTGFGAIEPQAPQTGEQVIKSMCLHVAHDCNLRCRYCFADTGEFHGPRGMMPPAVACKALDFLIAHSGHRKHLEVDLFGGEPLMNLETNSGFFAKIAKLFK